MRIVRCKPTSDCGALILRPKEAFALVTWLEEPERMPAVFAAGSRLRI
jgi:hypothetical protein